MPDRKISTERLPRLELTGPAGTVRLHAPQLGAPVLLLVRDASLERARAWMMALEQNASELRVWGGRPLLITEHVAKSAVPTVVAGDEVWSDLGIRDSALIIADRWGVVYFLQETTTFDDLPPVDEVIEWVRYLSMQCPECGVIDEPGYGEWALLS
ncbi:MAG: hypothetical protein ACRELT_00430 [Longimicrobiales bacterium]